MIQCEPTNADDRGWRFDACSLISDSLFWQRLGKTSTSSYPKFLDTNSRLSY